MDVVEPGFRESDAPAKAGLANSDVLVAEATEAPLDASAGWMQISTSGPQSITDTLSMSLSAGQASAVVAVEVRSHVDGNRHTVAVDGKHLGPGAVSNVDISLEALGIHSEIEFAASVEGTILVTRQGHTRTASLDPIHIHPVGEGFLIYGTEALETQFNGGDFRGVLPDVDDPETEAIAHVSIAQVRVLGPGEETELE